MPRYTTTVSYPKNVGPSDVRTTIFTDISPFKVQTILNWSKKLTGVAKREVGVEAAPPTV